MIDTIKIYTEIDKKIYYIIKSMSIVKSSIDNNTKQLQYEIINDHLKGSYDSSLSVRVSSGAKYHFTKLGYCIEIEGSYHKIVKGYNSHNGYYDLQFISENLIKLVELSYNIELPILDNWYLQRCDIAICFDLEKQNNVISYINSLSRCNYPRRKTKFFHDESLYVTGSTTTLKIYNKVLEFAKHDLKKFRNTDFDLLKYMNKIKGFIRFECEIKKRMLESIYNKKYIKIIDVNYEDLKNVWSDEFMKLLQFVKNDLEVVRNREEVLHRLMNIYKPSKANLLFNFYCACQLNGVKEMKEKYAERTYYRNIKALKEAKVDLSQSYKIEEMEIFTFNPFEYKEVV